mgnify:FL=1
MNKVIFNERREVFMENVATILNTILTDKDKLALENNTETIEKPPDYIDDESKLLICGNCHTPREKIVDFLGSKKKAPINCKCMAEKEREEKETRDKYRKEMWIRELRRACFDESIYANANFETMDKASEHEDIARNYVKHFDQVLKNNMGLIFTGEVGCGKTYLAAVIANKLIDQGISVKMTNFTGILNDMTNFDIDKAKYIDDLNEKKLLIIDDFGMERTTDFAYEHIFNIIDARYRVGKPLIITTNLNISQLTNPKGIREKRIYSRILEIASPIIFTGKNRRIEKMKEKSRQTYQLLKEGGNYAK